MDAGQLDVLHDRRHEGVRAVGDGVRLGLDRVPRNLSIRIGRSGGHVDARPGTYSRSISSSWTTSIARPPSTYDGRTISG